MSDTPLPSPPESAAPQSASSGPRLPGTDVLVAGAAGLVLLTAEGEVEMPTPAEARTRIHDRPVMVCHARSMARRLGMDSFAAYDVLELFAFVHPAVFCRPTPRGLAETLDLPPPSSLEEAALSLLRSAERLLIDLRAHDRTEASEPLSMAWAMGRGGWLWAPVVLDALGHPAGPEKPSRGGEAFKIWAHLPEWEAEAPRPPPGQRTVMPEDARRRLARLLGDGAEPRPQQADYASAAAAAFAPKAWEEQPTVVLSEAGTGVGKTLAYLAAASVWAEINDGAVWISTYTRNLQHQIDDELDRLHPDPARKAREVVLRKGRENYLCLLNMEEAVRMVETQPRYAVALGLMARWAAKTRDGDLSGGDFPGWLPDLVGRGRSQGLADRRGECIHSACPHYNRCFIERSVRRARKASIVVANHALVMVQAALGGMDDTHLPSRYVFDEGHHLFDAADSAFSAHLTGGETAELRRWLVGGDSGGRSSRMRGLRRRVEDLLSGDEAASEALDEIDRAARRLPADGWAARLSRGEEEPKGPAEAFLSLVRRQVLTHAKGRDGPYSLEAEAVAIVDGLPEAARTLAAELTRLVDPLKTLAERLRARLDDEADSLDTQSRTRLDAAARAIDRRALTQARAWSDMLRSLNDEPPEGAVDWFGVERIPQDAGLPSREIDVGFYRHWIDPTWPFARSLESHAHGVLVTSATLTDSTGDVESDWTVAEDRTGASRYPNPPIRARVPSPFDYPKQTRVIVVRDVDRDDPDRVAAAYRALVTASGGGALALFTAISRMKAVHGRVAGSLEEAGIPVFGQHVDGLDLATLVDIFRGEENACLFGTDALRDGVDVPGRSLRLIVFDRVPWPRPTILHRARRDAFGRGRYDDMITRYRLKQAFGRLVRRADDHGVFVVLDSRLPSRLDGAFPDGVEIERCGLAEAVETVKRFVGSGGKPPPIS
ncbi:ATP-dependent DNA helicase [Fodinicurvata sp. EGI_FJ10296]|uniref:ATP-dependent DNA helicase n=1 Tax=Fodinicurvata sp. EGI_FJ10296 TaxID=3231908 RepID=UPI0034531EE0